MDASQSIDKSERVLVVTDLDGTLLDHDDYGFAEVLPVLGRLKELGFPLVANTSKTAAEWKAMRGGFDNEDAYVVENGSAIIFPSGEVKILGVTREEVFRHLAELREEYEFVGFADLGVAGVIEATGLDEEAATLACDRQYSEPLVWKDTEEKQALFCAEIKRRGLMTLEGGRFLHVLGETDKGRALDVLRESESASFVIALGDSPNDVAMLEKADVACVIATSREEPLQVGGGARVLRSSLKGPKGWAEVMTPLLDQITNKQH